MEATTEALNITTHGITVVGSDAPSDYHIAPRSEPNPNPNPNPSTGSDPPPSQPEAHGASPPPPVPAAPLGMLPQKKKRGRPKKYGPDGTIVALSPRPISSAAPAPSIIDFSAGEKRSKMKLTSSLSKSKYEVKNLGEWAACSVGTYFTPHILTVNAGEDVTMKIMSFSQQGRAICILSANGVISSVTLRQPDSSGGTLTYEGRFEILSLSGSFMPNDTGGTRSRTGGMSVSLASPDGRVVGGGVAGLLVAASPIQVVIGSFLAGNQHEEKPKKQKQDYVSTQIQMSVVPISVTDPITSLSSSASLPKESWSSLPSDSRNKPSDINLPISGL